MTKQPEVLRLAEALECGTYLLYLERDNTAAELRRLHEVNQELLGALNQMLSYTAELNPNQGFDGFDHCAVNKAQAAIVKAIGEQA